MAKSEDTFICGEINDREQMIEDLAFLSDRQNYKFIKYAIKCIDKLEKIEQIVNNGSKENGISSLNAIRKILEQE